MHPLRILLVWMLLTGLLTPVSILWGQNNHNHAAPDTVGFQWTIRPADDPPDSIPPPLRVVDNHAFQVGEKLEYVIRYGRIIAGNSSLSIPEMVYFNGHPSFKIVSRAWSNKFFSKFYKVDDYSESIVDMRGIFSWRFEKHLREGSYKKDLIAIHDQINHVAYIDSSDTLKIPPFVHDILSAMFFIRTMDLAPGDTVYLDNQDNGKVYPLKIVIHRREKVKVKAGTFNCLVAEPFLRTPALFKQKGRIVVFLSDDQYKIPVLMNTYIYVKGFSLGAVVSELERYSGLPPRKKPPE